MGERTSLPRSSIVVIVIILTIVSLLSWGWRAPTSFIFSVVVIRWILVSFILKKRKKNVNVATVAVATVDAVANVAAVSNVAAIAVTPITAVAAVAAVAAVPLVAD